MEGAQAIDPKRLKWMYEAGENRAKQRKMEETGKSGGDARQRRENGIAERAEMGSLKNKVKVKQYHSIESVNNWWKKVMKYDKPPYKPRTVVQEIELIEDTTFVRIYDGIVSGQYGGWLMKADDIEGLTRND